MMAGIGSIIDFIAVVESIVALFFTYLDHHKSLANNFFGKIHLQNLNLRSIVESVNDLLTSRKSLVLNKKRQFCDEMSLLYMRQLGGNK